MRTEPAEATHHTIAEVKGAASALSTAGDLAELMTAFNEVTTRLERTHEQLRGEVQRLTGELEEAHEQLERGRRLAALGEMAAGIAHEIRNPLGSIGLYARMLEQDLVQTPEPHARASKISAAVRRLNEIVCDVLSFSRDMTPRPEPMDARDLIESALESAGLAGDAKAPDAPMVEIETDEADVLADPSLAHQALVNLLRNAHQAVTEQHGPGGGRVRASAKQTTEIDERGRRRPVCVLAVQDDGPGIPGEVVERMFNPFFTTRATGTGLGLAIVHRIVDAHGGRLAVRSDSDDSNNSRAGATVEMRLPVAA